MKKSVLILLTVLLIGCQKTPVKSVVKEKDIEVKEIVEIIKEVDYLDKEQLKVLMLKTNRETQIIDLEVLHEQLSDKLLKEVDLTIDIDTQIDLIGEIVNEELDYWRKDIVRDVLKNEQVILNDDDFDTLVARTSINDAYQLMLSYEKIFLKKQAK